MKAFKIILISILSLIDLYILYSAIGYLIWGANTPKIVGVENTCFMGMYIMSITYFCIFVVTKIIVNNLKVCYNQGSLYKRHRRWHLI